MRGAGFTPHPQKHPFSECEWRGAGFTLLEVMVTLTILGFIILMISGTFRLGLSAWERGESVKEEFQKVRIISQLISQQVKSIVPYKIKTKKAEGDYLAFEGKAHSLKFVTALSIKSKQPEGLTFTIYEFKEGGKEEGRIILYERKALNRDFFEDPVSEESGVPIMEGVSSARFEYYREQDLTKNRTEEWVEEWNTKEEKELPKALRMTIVPKNGKGEEKVMPMTLLISIPANRFEEVRTSAGPRRTRLERPQ